ncbi:MAG: oligosaccharide flippase family protein [Candidatus Bathyarchaeia archaeon]
MAKVSARGGFQLFWGIVASTMISAAGVIILARALQPQDYGLYTIALAAPNLIGTFRDWGMDSATIKYTAQYSAEAKPERVRSIILAGLIFELIMGLSLSFVSFALSGFIANDIFKRPITALIQISSFTILAGAFLNASQAAFTGREQMRPNSVTLVVGAIFRSLLAPVLVFVGFGVSGAVVGYSAGILGGGLVGIILMLAIYRNLGKHVLEKTSSVWQTMKFMFRYGLPLSFSSIFTSFLSQFYNFIIAIYASNYLIGNYAVANNFTVLLAFFATPITTMLFPAFSKLNAEKDRETLQIIFKSSIKYSSLLVIPPTVAIIALANPFVSALFGAKYADAPLFLSLLAFNYLLTAFGQLSTLNLISGQGQTRFYLELAVVNTFAGIVMAVSLVPAFGVIGLIVTLVFDGVPGLMISLYWIKMRYGTAVDWVSSAKILVSSAAAGSSTFFAVSFMSLSDWPKLIIGLIVFAATFLLSLIATRALKKPDIENLRLMASGLGPLKGIVDKLLNILETMVSSSAS